MGPTLSDEESREISIECRIIKIKEYPECTNCIQKRKLIISCLKVKSLIFH